MAHGDLPPGVIRGTGDCYYKLDGDTVVTYGTAGGTPEGRDVWSNRQSLSQFFRVADAIAQAAGMMPYGTLLTIPVDDSVIVGGDPFFVEAITPIEQLGRVRRSSARAKKAEHGDGEDQGHEGEPAVAGGAEDAVPGQPDAEKADDGKGEGGSEPEGHGASIGAPVSLIDPPVDLTANPEGATGQNPEGDRPKDKLDAMTMPQLRKFAGRKLPARSIKGLDRPQLEAALRAKGHGDGK